MINEGNWQLIFNANNQDDSLTIPLVFPVDSILVKVSLLTPQPTWRKAGWLNQYWKDGQDLWLLKTGQVQLNGHFMQLSPVNESLLVFNPVLWLVNWNISVFAYPQSIDQTSQKLDQTKQKLDEVLERLPDKDKTDFNLIL